LAPSHEGCSIHAIWSSEENPLLLERLKFRVALDAPLSISPRRSLVEGGCRNRQRARQRPNINSLRRCVLCLVFRLSANDGSCHRILNHITDGVWCRRGNLISTRPSACFQDSAGAQASTGRNHSSTEVEFVNSPLDAAFGRMDGAMDSDAVSIEHTTIAISWKLLLRWAKLIARCSASTEP